MSGESNHIRPARPGDRKRMEQIAQLAYAIYVPRMDRKPFPMLDDYNAHIERGNAHVLEDENGIQGYVILLPDRPNAMLLDNVAVDPACQGKGYGKDLILYAEQKAEELGASLLRLYTNEAMTENLSLYPHLGFRETHRARQNGYNRVFYEKKLK